MSIKRSNYIHIPELDLQRLWGGASIKVKQASSPTDHAYWRGARNVFSMLRMEEPPSNNVFISSLDSMFTEDEDARGGEC